MKKRKQNNHPLPPEYDYLGTLDHDGWRWEFLRRLESFRSDYNLVKGRNIHQYNQDWWDLGEKYSMTKEAREKFSCLDHSLTYLDLPDNIKPVFEGTMPIKSLHREKLLKEIRKTLKSWSYIEKDNPLWRLELDEYILLALEMSLRPGMFPQNVEYMGINLDASRTDLKAAFKTFLKAHIRPKTEKGDEKKYFGAHKTALIVWDLRAQHTTYSDIQKTTGIDKDTAKKKYYRAYELIYGRAYNPAEYEQPSIKKEYMKNYCDICKERHTCTDTDRCPDVIAFVDQDTKDYQREKTFSDMDLMTKLSQDLQEEKEEGSPVSGMNEYPDDDLS